MNSADIIARELARADRGAKVICGNIIGNVNPLCEWIKWLSYESELEREREQILNSKKNSEITSEECEEISKYKRNKVLAKLFKKYEEGECPEKEYMMVYQHMCNESIEELMISKLTPDELKYAKEEIIRLIRLPKSELAHKVREEKKLENYQKLSMVDSYILHIISDINYERSIDELEQEISIAIREQTGILKNVYTMPCK